MVLIGLKEWVRNKLEALASLLGKSGIKAAEALPGIIEVLSVGYLIELKM